jgi:hypothetical protein
MKTDQLLDLLAADTRVIAPNAAARRLALAVLAGLPISAAIVAWDYGFRHDLAQVAQVPMFWVKLLFPLVLAVAAFVGAQRLARPGVPAGRPVALGVALPVLAVWTLALVAWWLALAAERPALLWGQTWRSCAFSIGFIALPVLVSSMLALKTLAPTRPAWAGAAAGALAGGAGAAIYALHCPELTAPFLAVWYVLGMALPTAAGAAIGSRWLRW